MIYQNTNVCVVKKTTMISFLLLQKSVYPYEHMVDWKKLNQTSFPEKKDFCGHLNMEDKTRKNKTHKKNL